jgi:drug/metabolite transporter (DMT)-like permease
MSQDSLAIILRVGSGILFALMVACVKAMSDAAPTGQIVFYRSAYALIPLVGYLWIRGEFPKGLKTKYPIKHVFRCLTGCCAMFASFATLAYLTIAESTMLTYLSPIFVVIFAQIFLKEVVPAVRWVAVILGVFGTGVLVVPELMNSRTDNESYLIGVSLGVLAAILTAASIIQIRNLAKTEHPAAIAFYFALTCAIFGLCTLPLGWAETDFKQEILLLGAGLFGGFAHILVTTSFQLGEASKLAPYEYLSLIWAVIIGVTIFGNIPSLSFYAALPFIVGSAAIVAFKEGFRRNMPR